MVPTQVYRSIFSILPDDYWGLMPIPLFVITAVVAGLTLNSSATNFTTAVKGASSGTESLVSKLRVSDLAYVRNGNLGSEALVILKVTFCAIFF